MVLIILMSNFVYVFEDNVFTKKVFVFNIFPTLTCIIIRKRSKKSLWAQTIRMCMCIKSYYFPQQTFDNLGNINNTVSIN